MRKLQAVTLLAEANARRRRSPVTIFLTVLLLFSPVALFVWWVWPAPPPSALALAVFDQVALPNESVLLSVQLEAVEAGGAQEHLAGLTLYVQDWQTDQLLAVRPESSGWVHIERQYAASDAPAEIVARFAGDEHRRGAQAHGRVFIWPPETRLLLVDADHTLANASESALWTVNNLTLPAFPDAAPALRALRATYRIVYLSAGADRATRYRKLRGWLERGWALPEQRFPDGPLLSPTGGMQEMDAPVFCQAVSAGLRHRFRGDVVAVAQRLAESQAFRDAGFQAFLLGEAEEIPPGVTALPSWTVLAKRLLGEEDDAGMTR